MEFRQVEAFVVVSELESFTRAANQLHLTQSAVSQLVKRLEEEVGEALFIRSGRSVHPTRAGIDLLPVALEILKWRQVLVRKTHPDPSQLSGGLRVGTSSAATAFLWASTFQAFAQAYPLVELDVRSTQRTINTLEDLLKGELDVGILPFPLPHSRLSGDVLGHHEALLVASPKHPLANKESLTRSDIETARFILYEQRMNVRALTDYYFSNLGVSPPVVLQSNDTHLISAMTAVGFGVAFLPDWGIQRELQDGTLVPLNIPGPRLFEEFGTMYLSKGMSATTEEFVRFCKEHNDLLPEISRGGLHREAELPPSRS